MAATKFGWPALPPSVAISGARAPSAPGRYRPARRCRRPPASPAPMPKARQNARLCHSDARSAAAAARPIAASMRDQACAGGATGATASASPPSRSSQNATSDASAGSCARRRSTSRRSSRAEHAQHVFGGDQLAAVGRTYGVVLAHASRQALQFQQSAPDPALHRAERHAHALGQLLIGGAVEERRADRAPNGALPVPPGSRRGAGAAAPAPRARPRPGPGSLTASAASIGSMRRLTAVARSRSIARLRAIATSQVIGLASAGSKVAALRHTVT